MRQAIEERMNRQIEKSRTYNGMFDAAVSAVETAASGSAVQVSDNQFSVTSNTLTTYITCSDNDYATINVNIDYQTGTGNMRRVANLNVNIDGAYEETYITCSDNDYATINVNIDYQVDTGNMQRVADLNVNIDGVYYEETYHSIPRAIRSAVFDIVNDVIDAVCGFLDDQNYSDAVDTDGE
jgi:hypothetical protein